VHVGGDGARLDREHARAADGHVLADGGDQPGQLLGHGVLGAGVVRRLYVLHILAHAQREARHFADEVLEVLVPRHEVGLGIDLDHGGDLRAGGDADQPLGGDAAALLGGGGQALLAQPVDGRVHVAVGLDERLLAVHHAGAARVAQFADEGGCDFGHVSLSRIGFLGGAPRPRGTA